MPPFAFPHIRTPPHLVERSQSVPNDLQPVEDALKIRTEVTDALFAAAEELLMSIEASDKARIELARGDLQLCVAIAAELRKGKSM